MPEKRRRTMTPDLQSSPTRPVQQNHAASNAFGDLLSSKTPSAVPSRIMQAKGRLIAAKIEGKYWMYWGEGSIRLANSPDLIHWTPIEDAQGAPIELLRP
ncbi:MAG: pesticidal protein Cry15Aa, partial [Terracidiphilus sp.]